MNSAFVTGGTGFIGSHLVEELIRRGVREIRCLVRTERKWLEGLPIRVVRGDLFDDEVVRDAVRDVDVVFHNAGTTRARSWDEFRRNNVETTVRLLETVATVHPAVSRVVVTSSLAAVGACDGDVATESNELRPVSRYGRSKSLMENEIRSFDDRVPVTVIRPSSVYGPRDADIYTFFKSVDLGICPVVGNVSKPVLSLVHVRDLVRGMVDAATADAAVGETYFLGSETFYSWSDVKEAATEALESRALTVSIPPALVGLVGSIVEGIGRLTGSQPPLNRDKSREIRRACKMCSVEKAKRELGYRQLIPLGEGVHETISWYRREGWL